MLWDSASLTIFALFHLTMCDTKCNCIPPPIIRCLLTVESLVLPLVVVLGFSNALFNVGNASFFKRTRNFSLNCKRSRNCGEFPGSYASSAKCREHILVHDDGWNAFRLQNSIHAFRLYCWSADFPDGKEKKWVGGPIVFWLSLLQPYTGQYMFRECCHRTNVVVCV